MPGRKREIEIESDFRRSSEIVRGFTSVTYNRALNDNDRAAN